jgi:SAM-dependent methyltransferase
MCQRSVSLFQAGLQPESLEAGDEHEYWISIGEILLQGKGNDDGVGMKQEKIWDYFQAGDDSGDAFSRSRPRYKYLAKHVKSSEKVLNIGVGRGGLEALLLAKGVRVSCLDPGEKAIEMLRQRHRLGDRAQVGYSQAMPFPDAAFDVVIMSEVLEHLDDDVLALTLKEVIRVLKPAGTFIGTVPADERLPDAQVMCPHCGESFHRWGHVQSFDAHRLRTLFAGYFEVLKVERHYFGDFHGLNLKGRVAWLLKKALVTLGTRGGGETSFFCCRRH